MPMRVERSAGVVVFHQAKAPPPADLHSGRSYLLLNYGKYWDYPKGHVEKGESDLDAAMRELKEETGIEQVEPVEGFKEEMTYFFRDKKKGLIKKTVVFFLARSDSDRVVISDEHEGGEFVAYDQALKQLGYDNARKILRAAEEFLTNCR
jgi:8-oxo-dGTP pyrophosphatase MutT (NUDIX family)